MTLGCRAPRRQKPSHARRSGAGPVLSAKWIQDRLPTSQLQSGPTLRSVASRLLLLLVLVAPTLADSASRAIEAKDGKAAAAKFEDAIRVNIRAELRAELAPIVAAIRHAENGRAGREYGILGAGVQRDMKRRGETYRTQAGWCAATVQKTYDRWTKAGKPGDFVTFLGKRYCPVGADNDPQGLNRHWVKNVTAWRKKIAGGAR